MTWLRDLAEVGLGVGDITETLDGICDWQSPSGMIPWFPGGHADPWTHIEAAMALAVGGDIAGADVQQAIARLQAQAVVVDGQHRRSRPPMGSPSRAR